MNTRAFFHIGPLRLAASRRKAFIWAAAVLIGGSPANADPTQPVMPLQSPQNGALSDSLLPAIGHPVGIAMEGTALTGSALKWGASNGITIGGQGATASAPGGAHHSIDAVAGTIRLQADVNPQGSGFTGLALGRGDLSGNFWANVSILFFVTESGYNVAVGSDNLIANADPKLLRADGPNHLELLVDTIARTVTARLNGTLVLDAVSLPATARVSDITAAGFRFNEPVTAGKPSVSNYRAEVIAKASSGLEPIDLDTYFVSPDQKATLRWRVGKPGPSTAVPYIVRDYTGHQTGSGDAVLSPDHIATLARAFPRGYSEISFPEANQTFGVVALEPHSGAADPFFCMDSGLSWLELSSDRRAALVKNLARCGIAQSRERLGIGNVNPAKDQFDWETNRSFDSLRKMYAASDVSVLEILDDGGGYLGSPRDLPGLSTSATQVAKHWQVWGGAEASNEPDLQPNPADQYVPLVKTLSYALAQAHSDVPLVSGVFASIPPGPYFDTAQANGMLEDSDAVSFHSYDRAPSVEGMVTRYRTWLKKSGKESLPLWHSECGWSWRQGPDRPPQDQDALSALEITAKAIETRVCGVNRYFPFVYVFYEEGQKNFGMMGREATPLRSMASYAACAQALSGKKYIGDLAGLDASVKMARVFANPNSNECVAVLYSGSLDPQAKINFPFKVKRLAGADGRTLPQSAQSVSLADGMVYVWMNTSEVRAKLKTDTNAMRLYKIGQHPLVQKRRASPVVLQFLAQQTPSRSSASRYLVTQELSHELPLNVRAYNLSQTPITFTPEISLPGKTGEKMAPVTLPALGHSDIAWKLDATSSLDVAQTRLITVSGHAETGVQPLPLAIPVIMEGTLEQHLKRHTRQAVQKITDLNNWKTNIASHGTSKFSVTGDSAWRMDVKFAGTGGNWAYPNFVLPEKLDPTLYSGFLLRARVFKGAGNVALIAESGGGSPSFWVTDLFPADGEWHVVYVPFAEFKPGPNSAGNQNTRLDVAAWKEISMGMGSYDAENAIEVSHFIAVGGSDN